MPKLHSKKEWDFRNVPETELWACIVWEYGRRSWVRLHILAVLSSFKAHLSEYPCSWPPPDSVIRFPELKGGIFGLVVMLTVFELQFGLVGTGETGFPNTPWLGLPSQTRSRLSIILAEYNYKEECLTTFVQATGKWPSVNNPAISEFVRPPEDLPEIRKEIIAWDGGYCVSTFIFSWRSSDADLHKGLKDWLIEKRPSEFKQFARKQKTSTRGPCRLELEFAGKRIEPARALNCLAILALDESSSSHEVVANEFFRRYDQPFSEVAKAKAIATSLLQSLYPPELEDEWQQFWRDFGKK